MLRTIAMLCITVVAIAVGGCASGDGDGKVVTRRVTGTVTYLQQLALPPDAEVRVALQDITVQDAPPRPIASASIMAAGKQVPISFSIEYDPAKIVESRTYSVHAELYIDGERRFMSTQAYPVITRDAPSAVDIVVMALERTLVATPLVGTYWKLVAVGGRGVVSVEDARREPHLTLLPEENQAIATGGCNQMSGTYRMTETELKFSQFASTRMACPEVMEQEGVFGRALAATSGYRIAGQALELTDAKGATLARFEAAVHED